MSTEYFIQEDVLTAADSLLMKLLLNLDSDLNVTRNYLKERMSMTKQQQINDMVEYLNKCRYFYYVENNSPISDEKYDQMFDELKRLEDETGIILSNSPTQQVGYTVLSNLEKVEHFKPLLSLDKAKDIESLKKFRNGRDILLMHKLDGLTCQLTYVDGKLTRAETRGDGYIGEDITHNAKTFIGVPSAISVSGTIRITGEAIIHKDDFVYINSKLDEPYKNPRNLASGSVRQLIAAFVHLGLCGLLRGMLTIFLLTEQWHLDLNMQRNLALIQLHILR